ncbi:hypothetical protein BU17DRAFT_65425 [Hysterangium stoloniferum]|nr:hypothetical protein BU17DRAFT_65425 [Hysterangium stoloniferum]
MQVPTLMGWTQIIKASLDEFRQHLYQDLQMPSHNSDCATSNNIWHRGEQNSNPAPPQIHLQFESTILHQDTNEMSYSTSTGPPGDPKITLRIPKIIKHQKNNLDVPPGWKQAVDHWVKGDPSQNSPALKDWNPEWMKGKYKKMYTEAYYRCKVVALEFLERFNGNEAVFLDA